MSCITTTKTGKPCSKRAVFFDYCSTHLKKHPELEIAYHSIKWNLTMQKIENKVLNFYERDSKKVKNDHDKDFKSVENKDFKSVENKDFKSVENKDFKGVENKDFKSVENKDFKSVENSDDEDFKSVENSDDEDFKSVENSDDEDFKSVEDEITTLPNEPQRCQGITKKGNSCKNIVKSDTKFCHLHHEDTSSNICDTCSERRSLEFREWRTCCRCHIEVADCCNSEWKQCFVCERELNKVKNPLLLNTGNYICDNCNPNKYKFLCKEHGGLKLFKKKKIF